MSSSRLEDARIYCNGLELDTGRSPYPIQDLQWAASVASRQAAPRRRLLRRLLDIFERHYRRHYDWVDDVDFKDPSAVGWGIVLPESRQGVRKDVDELVELRRAQVGSRLFELSYPRGMSCHDWLAHHQVVAGRFDLTKIPFYLLLIGGPEDIPWEFQYQLGAEYAVGRLAFDQPDGYRHYARSLERYANEDGSSHRRRALVFATRHQGDEATRISSQELIEPLVEESLADAANVEGDPISLTCLKGSEATKAALLDQLHGKKSPLGLWISATHGLDVGTHRGTFQRERQGALICHGLSSGSRIEQDDRLSSSDIGADASVHGMVALLFACFSAGTPREDNFPYRSSSAVAKKIADAPFVAALPQRLLSHENGSALAVIGHVERAWSCSISIARHGLRTAMFSDWLEAVVRGWPIGFAMRPFARRHCALAHEVARMFERVSRWSRPPSLQQAHAWLEHNDARNWVLLGDPAVSSRPFVLESEPRAEDLNNSLS